MSESTTGTEFLLGIEEYLRYLNSDKQAERLHSIARTFASDNIQLNTLVAFIQNLTSELYDKDRFLSDLLHSSIKSENVTDIPKVLLHYISKITTNDKNLVDLIHQTTKSENLSNVYKILLHYISKITTNDKNLVDLIHQTTKSENLSNIYKVLLQYISKINGDDKNILDLIHGTIKSENLLSYYKVLLHYVSKVIEDSNISSLSLSISRSVQSDNFENDFIKSYLAMLDRQFMNDKLFRGVNNLIKTEVPINIRNDIFSRGQVRSKIWLIEELCKIQKNFDNVVILAGWLGQIKNFYEKRLTYNKMRIIEIDKWCCETSDYVFNLSNLENHKVKSVHSDINKLTLHKNGYEFKVENFKDDSFYIEKFNPDLIINTSAEHMTEDWFHQIRNKGLDAPPILAIQSNNLFDIPEHVNCVYSVDHMKKKFPMSEILFEGELQLKGYKRVMLIGKV